MPTTLSSSTSSSSSSSSSSSISIFSSASASASASAPTSASTTTFAHNNPNTLKPNSLTQIHTYTLCPHTSPPANRPLNVQPTLDPVTNASTIAGRCSKCDQIFRRDAESAILDAYLKEIKTAERQYGVFDEEFLDKQVAELYRQRDTEVERVWSGYPRRWGPGCVGRMENGRMKLAWERPERVETGEVGVSRDGRG